jgi:hypothetical protein
MTWANLFRVVAGADCAVQRRRTNSSTRSWLGWLRDHAQLRASGEFASADADAAYLAPDAEPCLVPALPAQSLTGSSTPQRSVRLTANPTDSLRECDLRLRRENRTTT